MSQNYTVEVEHQGQTYTLSVPEDKQIIRAAYSAGMDTLPSACNSGVCTTCAALVVSGEVDHGDAMGLSPELREKGYVLLCVAKPKSDLKIISEKEDEVYDLQFGQFQQTT